MPQPTKPFASLKHSSAPSKITFKATAFTLPPNASSKHSLSANSCLAYKLSSRHERTYPTIRPRR
ncbi:hypothetical protein [Rubritalea tangerina]|uniref:hypothetical protein n=1 Tax=Rubritalea tangerina TaxID=430798 RepID=UPI003620BC35